MQFEDEFDVSLGPADSYQDRPSGMNESKRKRQSQSGTVRLMTTATPP